MEILFSSHRQTNQTFWRRSGTENTHLDTGTPNSRRESQRFSWRTRRVCSTTSRLTSGWRWSDKWFLVHVRKLHFPPSHWTESQTLLAERRIIPFSTERHWRLQNYKNQFGCYARTPHRWPLEYRWIKRFVWFSDRFHSVYSFWRETSRRIRVVRGEIDKTAGNIQARSFMARALDKNWESNAKLKEKHKWSNEQPKLDNARRLRGIYFIDPEDKELKETSKNVSQEIANTNVSRYALQDKQEQWAWETLGKTNDIKSKFACILEASESTRLRMEESLPNYHEDPYCRKRWQFTATL